MTGKMSAWFYKDRATKCSIAFNSCIFSFSFGKEGSLSLAEKNVEKTLRSEVHICSFYTE